MYLHVLFHETIGLHIVKLSLVVTGFWLAVVFCMFLKVFNACFYLVCFMSSCWGRVVCMHIRVVLKFGMCFIDLCLIFMLLRIKVMFKYLSIFLYVHLGSLYVYSWFVGMHRYCLMSELQHKDQGFIILLMLCLLFCDMFSNYLKYLLCLLYFLIMLMISLLILCRNVSGIMMLRHPLLIH